MNDLTTPGNHARSDKIEACRRRVSARPESAVAWLDLAAVLEKAGDHKRALIALNQAARLETPEPAALLARGRLLQALDRFEDAIPTLQDAVSRHPLFIAAHLELAQLIWTRSGDVAQATRALRRAIANHPENPALRLALAKVLGIGGFADLAYDESLQALTAAPGDGGVMAAAARHALNAGDAKAALALACRVTDVRPGMREAFEVVCSAAMQLGRFDIAYTAASEAARQIPDDPLALGFLALASRQENAGLFSTLYDFDRDVVDQPIPVPAGWPCLQSYLKELKGWLELRHVATDAPFDQSVRSGSQISLRPHDRGDRFVKAFFETADRQVREHLRRVSAPFPPWRARGGDTYEISGAWSVRLRSGGRHENHVHPQGWISSAFYVSLPRMTGGSSAGWLALGQGPGSGPPPRLIQPREGHLVLFPSHMFHGTVPFQADGARLTIAFDIVPGPAAPPAEA